MGRIAETVHEISIWADLAVALAGLEDCLEVLDEEPDFDLSDVGDMREGEACRTILFETAEGRVLPLQVVCTETLVAIYIARDEDEGDGESDTPILAEARSIKDLEGFVEELCDKLEAVCLVPTRH